jgi:DNA-binding winged helix-turn-helix (wHTH) protein
VRYRFGDCEIDDATRQLWCAGVERHLGPKAFDFLLLLVRARPRVLSKAELHAQLWPDSYVTDASLTTLASEIRTALDERASGSRWLRTVHRRGYAFSPEVLEEAAAEATSYWLQAELRQIGLRASDNIVGRDPHVQVWLDDATVSRKHARITIDGGRITLEDLQSKNGTFVRGERIDGQAVLADGDALQFGSVGVMFRIWAPGAETKSARTVPPQSSASKRRP